VRSVAIVGAPNVGKSALFNRLAGRRVSIVHNQPGVTRDRVTAISRLATIPFEVTDTGGLGAEPDPEFALATQEAAAAAIRNSSVLLFVVDGQKGVTPLDAQLAKDLRRSSRPVVLVVNKVDAPEHEDMALDFARLGFSQTVAVSAAHGRGISELIEALEGLLGPDDGLQSDSNAPRIAFVGRPNVGKSSLINAIVKDRRAIVSEVPGTTRDALDIACTRNGRPYIVCDTAGIRHRSKHDASVEVFSVMRAEAAIRGANLCVLVLDATSDVTMQDKKIGALIQKAQKAVIIALNKWDLQRPSGGSGSELLTEHVAVVREKMFFLDYAPVTALSARTGENVSRLFAVVERVRQQATRRITTGELNRLLRSIIERHPPPYHRNKQFKLLYATQRAAADSSPFQPPEFLLFVNDPKLLRKSYLAFLRARLREELPFPGLPILLSQRGRKKLE
jgi:GTPase